MLSSQLEISSAQASDLFPRNLPQHSESNNTSSLKAPQRPPLPLSSQYQSGRETMPHDQANRSDRPAQPSNGQIPDQASTQYTARQPQPPYSAMAISKRATSDASNSRALTSTQGSFPSTRSARDYDSKEDYIEEVCLKSHNS